jgi:hypothetical protein
MSQENEPHVGQVLVVHPGDTGIRQARAKTDRLDARALAKLLAAGSLDGLWMPDEQTPRAAAAAGSAQPAGEGADAREE